MIIGKVYDLDGAGFSSSIGDKYRCCPSCGTTELFTIICEGRSFDNNVEFGKINYNPIKFLKCRKCDWKGFSDKLLEQDVMKNIKRTKMIDRMLT